MIIGTSVGIELTGKDLRLAVLRSAFGKVRLVGTISIEGFADLPVDDQKAAISKVIKERNLSINHVFLSLPQSNGIVRQLEFPVEVREKLRSVIGLQLETLSPWPSEDIYWDFATALPAKNSKTVRATVVIVPRAVLDPWIQFFKAVRLPLSGASLSSMAWAHGVGAMWSTESPTIVLECEPGRVEAALVQRKELHSVVQLHDDINVAARSAVERLVAIGRVNSSESTRVLAHGPAVSSLEGLERMALPLENAKSESSDSFGPIACALGGVKKSGFQANLIPVALRYRRSQLQFVPTYVLLALGVILGLALLVRQPYQLVAYATNIDTEIQKISPVAREVSKQQAELNKLSERYRALAAHLQHHDYNLEALREIARVLPPTAFLANYNYQDGAITISGLADSATEVQKLLEDSPLFREVQFTNSLSKDAKGKDRFTLKAAIEVAK